jgi:hypothetical protein
MKLADFERTDDNGLSRYVTRVPDEGGTEEFELRFAGPREMTEQMLADATIELTIDSTRDDSWVKEEFESTHKEHRRSMWELAALEDIDTLLKPAPRRPDRDSSVFASARPVSGDGTPFFLSIPRLAVPAGASLFFSGSWVLFTTASIRPASGDQDLFLHFWSPTGPLLQSSRFGGTAVDIVSFSFLVFPFVPVFRIFGFTAGMGSFVALGA